jgi:endonuclease/exonuclease/phosphatase family metal-dependent hydrolase
VVQRVEADVVALQEVDNVTSRTGQVDQAAELGRLTGMQAVFGRAIDFGGGQYGNAILSRWPIVETANHPLPHTEGLEARAALAATIAAEGAGRFVLITTHMQHNSADDRLAQARKINELFAEDEEPGHRPPMILAGDVNAPPGSPPLEEFLRHWTDTTPDSPQPTFPADQPRRKIDYVFYRPAAEWRVIEAYVVDEPMASDHRPLFVVLERLERP